MADLQEQLQSILGDPEAIAQITAVARALTGGGGPTPSSPPPQAQDVDFIPVDGDADPSPPPPEPGPDQGPDLGSLLGMLGGGGTPDIDPRLLQIALRVFGEYSARDDEKAALLGALKPFLREERLEKLERAEKIARLSRVVRVAVQLLKEEGREDV